MARSLWYQFFEVPFFYRCVRSFLLFGKKKMYTKIKNAVALRDGESILDIGCGPGELSVLFSGDYTGLEYSKRYVDYAQRKYPNKKFVQGDALKLPFSEKSFDKVLLASFIHHFSDAEVELVLRNIQNIVRTSIVLLEPVQRKSVFYSVFLRMDRGNFIRRFDQQKELVQKYFIIKNASTFRSGFYTLSIIVAQPKA